MHIPAQIRGGFEEPLVDHLGDFCPPDKFTVEHVVINPVLAKQVGEASAVLALDRIAEFSQHRGRVHRASTILNGLAVAASHLWRELPARQSADHGLYAEHCALAASSHRTR
jgi:hypothetical protein